MSESGAWIGQDFGSGVKSFSVASGRAGYGEYELRGPCGGVKSVAV